MIIVQLGTNKGNDKLTEYIKNNNVQLDLGIFVEAMPFHIKDIKECYKNYPNVVIENLAIKLPNDEKKEMTLYYHLDDGPNYEVASFDYNHVFKHYHNDKIESIVIPSISLEELLDKYNLKKIDWLLIDIEGMDADIVETFNWSKYDIKRIDVEHIHWGNKMDALFQKFYDMGYKHVIANDIRYDVAFEKIEKENPNLKKLEVYSNGNFIGWVPKQDNNWWLDEEIPHSFNFFNLDGFYNETYFEIDHVPESVVNYYYNYILYYYNLITDKNLSNILECGTAGGWFTKKFFENGIDIIGLEGSECGIKATKLKDIPSERIIKHDLRNPISLNRKFDMVCCTEVAEHLEIPFAATLIRSLVEHSDLIWFSSIAPTIIKTPSNYHHINEQPEIFWINLFRYFGFDYIKLPDYVFYNTSFRGRFIFYNRDVYNPENFKKELYSELTIEELLSKLENNEITKEKYLNLIKERIK